jgi:nitroreductase
MARIEGIDSNPIIQAIRSRRVVRYFSGQPVTPEILEAIVEAARWAPSGGNRRLHKFVVVTRPKTIENIRILAPGIDGFPAALIVICTDWQKAEAQGFAPHHRMIFIDIGTAAENMLLAAHALGIGAGPVTSFSQAAVQELLDLPGWLSPDLIICLGYAGEKPPGGNVKPVKPLRWQDLTFWEKYPEPATEK